MRIGVTGLSAVAVLLAALGSARAQMPPGPPPAPGFVSSFEIVHTLRAAGFEPLAPPLREGTIYVARATDYRGIPMRVVLDARTGAIRDANRIVPGPGNYAPPYGPYGEAADSYGRPLYGPGPYGPPDDEADEDDGPPSYGRVGAIPLPYGGPPNRPPNISSMSGVAPLPPPPAHAANGASGPPLPRPRPPELAARQPAVSAKPPVVAADPKPTVAADPAKPDVKASVPPASAPPAAPSTAAPSASAVAPAAPPPARKPPAPLTINN